MHTGNTCFVEYTFSSKFYMSPSIKQCLSQKQGRLVTKVDRWENTL